MPVPGLDMARRICIKPLSESYVEWYDAESAIIREIFWCNFAHSCWTAGASLVSANHNCQNESSWATGAQMDGAQTAYGSEIPVRGKSCILMALKRKLVRNGSLKDAPGKGVSMFGAVRTKTVDKDEGAD